MISWKPVQGAAYPQVTIASTRTSLLMSLPHAQRHVYARYLSQGAQSGGIYVRVVVYDNRNCVGQYLMEPRFVPRPAVPEVAGSSTCCDKALAPRV